jgi:hypothetical protein
VWKRLLMQLKVQLEYIGISPHAGPCKALGVHPGMSQSMLDAHARCNHELGTPNEKKKKKKPGDSDKLCHVATTTY